MIWVEYGWKYILYYYNRLIINNIANKNDGSNILHKRTCQNAFLGHWMQRPHLVLLRHAFWYRSRIIP
jgi:hypothetical protein